MRWAAKAGLMGLCAGALFLGGGAAAQTQAASAPEGAQPLDDYDPWERTNRRLFAAHERIDMAVLAPSARGYRTVAPQPVRRGVSNFLRNLRGPQIFANDVLQGEVRRAGTTVGRFLINSTLGVLGVLDPASNMGLERHSEDFGQTLAVWGVPAGPYLFVPALGPTNARDGIGAVINLALDPISYAHFDYDTEFMVFRIGMSALSARESVIEVVDNVRESSIDPYVTIRSTYGLMRESAVRNGLQDVQDLPDFETISNEPGMDASAPGEPPTPQAAQGEDISGGVAPPQASAPLSEMELRGFVP